MRRFIRDERGHMDPIMSVLPFCLAAVLFGNPRLIAAISDGLPTTVLSWSKLLAVAGVLFLIQALGIVVGIQEAHHDALSGGKRGGLNRAPALQGRSAPVGFAFVYAIGIWPLIRMEPRPTWAIVASVAVIIGIVVGGILAERNGRKKAGV